MTQVELTLIKFDGSEEFIYYDKNTSCVNLNNCQISEIKGLNQLTRLRNLDLSSNNITEIKGLEGLEKLTRLRELFLDDNNITEIKGIKTLINLDRIFLDHNNITEIKGIKTLEKLMCLSLKNNPITKINYFELPERPIYSHINFSQEEKQKAQEKIKELGNDIIKKIWLIRQIQYHYRLHLLKPHHPYNIRTSQKNWDMILKGEI